MKMNKCVANAGVVFCLCFAAFVHATDLRGKVVAVADGDTVTVLDATHQQHKVRLSGIDAPERGQAFGEASKQQLSNMVFGRDVHVSWQKHDQYGRIVGKIMLGELDVCLTQVRLGMAWHYKRYQSEQTSADQSSYAATESVARSEQVGLWADPNPVAPWDFRRASRRQPGQLPAAIGLLQEAQPVVQP